MRDDFAIFICTHGRPDKQLTMKMLMARGYSGKVYLVLDDTDKTVQEYIDVWGAENIYIFNKNHYINTCDTGNNIPYYKTILYAKNAVEDIAKSLGLSYFVIADDDIFNLRIRFPEENKLKSFKIFTLDNILEYYIDFMQDADLAILGFGTMFYSGIKVLSPSCLMNLRVPFNFVFRRTTVPIDWKSSYGEDIITATFYQKFGYRMLVVPYVQIDMIAPGSGADGGMDQTYADRKYGIFKCLLYFLMFSPGTTHLRSHMKSRASTKINVVAAYLQNKTFPKILSDSYKKES